MDGSGQSAHEAVRQTSIKPFAGLVLLSPIHSGSAVASSSTQGLAGQMEGPVTDGGVTYVRIQAADGPAPGRLQPVGGALQAFVAETWVALSDGRRDGNQVRSRRCRCAARPAF